MGENGGRWQALTVTCPLGVSGSSQWMTIVLELIGRTWTLRGADPGSGRNFQV